jgi:hypothetical protein
MKSGLILLCFLPVRLLLAADYEILEKAQSIEMVSPSFAREHHRQTVRILTEEGSFFRETIPVNSFIQIKNVTGTVTCPDGDVGNLSPRDIAELPYFTSSRMLTDLKALVIAPSGLQRGCTFRLEYDRAVNNFLYISAFVYASSVPIRKASCSITFPSNVSMKYRADDSQLRIERFDDSGRATILMEAVDQKEITLYGDSENFGNVEKKVVFLPEEFMTERWPLSTRSWGEVATWFNELSKFAYQPDPAMDPIVNEVRRSHREPREIAEALYQYVQKSYAYTAIEVGIGGYKPRFASQTFQKKYGDCKDLTFLYLMLLRKAGVEGYPALVDTRSKKFFHPDFPSPSQFNHCIAYLPAIGGGTWVDTTVKNFRLGEIPSVIQGKSALVAGGPNALLTIPDDPSTANVLRLHLSGVYSKGRLQMAGQVQTTGQTSMLMEVLKDALKTRNFKSYVSRNLLARGLPFENLATKPESDRSFEIAFSTPVAQRGAYQVLYVNPLRYSALDHLSPDPQPNQFFALGGPVRLILETRIDLSGGRATSNFFKQVGKNQFISYHLELSEKNKELLYFADAFFANGFLDHVEMRRYQKELREFSQLLERMVVIQSTN